MLLAIAVFPLCLPRWWEPNRHKLLVSVAVALPVVAVYAVQRPAALLHAAEDYVSFVLLLAGLFVISGGILLRGDLVATPAVNTAFLAVGGVLASFVGTTGAAMLLVRPLLQTNSERLHVRHTVVFFIFIVANVGGMLTPLGDPPLFLGFLRGVPFGWTLRLWPQWLFANGILLAAFAIVDLAIFRRETVERPIDLERAAVEHETPVRIAGKQNLLWLLAVLAVLGGSGTFKLHTLLQDAALLALVALSWLTTPRELRAENGFTWTPIVEVASLFAGIFATMIPALAILNVRGATLGLSQPWHYFWATGLLSSLLDNAPTYLTFASAASGAAGTNADNLGELLHTLHGTELLAAISLGAVLMGANTYIGNGPNFMVKAIAEAGGVKMPGFFGYMAWSGAILLPLFAALTWVFLL
jgi:Na+/H+ antiporter NhaD/arsenite permease-like protein